MPLVLDSFGTLLFNTMPVPLLCLGQYERTTAAQPLPQSWQARHERSLTRPRQICDLGENDVTISPHNLSVLIPAGTVMQR